MPALLVVGILAVFAISELLLSPIGLSVTTKLAPGGVPGPDDGAVLLLRRASAPRCRVCWPVTTIRRKEFAYFGIIGAVAIVAGVVVFAISPWISRLMEGVH